MKILKNVIIPILIIVFATKYRMENPEIKIGIIGNLICFILVYFLIFFPLYYIFCKIYPDKDNLSFPPQFLPSWRQKEAENAKETQAFKTTGYSSILIFIIGGFLWYYLPIKFTENELLKNGKKTKSTILKERHSKTFSGRIKIYEYKDQNGIEYSDFVKDDRLKVGDTITVIYSTKRPEINNVVVEK